MTQARTILATTATTLALTLAGCTWWDDPPTVGPDAEKVRLVMFFSDGDWDGKSVGNWALIDSGETLHVKRRTIRPESSITTSDWNNTFLPMGEKPPQIGHYEMLLDRKRGVVCLKEKCGWLYAICPHFNETKFGKKCASYTVK